MLVRISPRLMQIIFIIAAIHERSQDHLKQTGSSLTSQCLQCSSGSLSNQNWLEHQRQNKQERTKCHHSVILLSKEGLIMSIKAQGVIVGLHPRQDLLNIF